VTGEGVSGFLTSDKATFGLVPTTAKSAAAVAVTTTQLGMFDFIKEGKKALVKSLAGDYDSAAIQARMDGLIENNKVLMFSFTT